MASVLCRRVRQVSQSSVVHTLLQRIVAVRGFSAAGSSGSDEPYISVPSQNSGPTTVWPDEMMGPFGPQDQRFQLPGNVGFDCHLKGTELQMKVPVHRTVPDVLTTPSSAERHEFILAQFVNEYQGKEVSLMAQRVSKAEHYFSQSNVECSMHSCPELLKKELELFFPVMPMSPITVVTVTQKNQLGTEELNRDQEELLDHFVSGAKEICFTLWRGGYWADFINPLSGKAVSTFLSLSKQMLELGVHLHDNDVRKNRTSFMFHRGVTIRKTDGLVFPWF
ncbi:metabolism of cobalamin associated Da [Pimephales promelas]|uniref:metabolism of cobalamin associated Da n=1 Tax=Pimephales promelas TaxID=90988 RepID=UPI001955BE1E|nr:metabolism of cobalamin associated Da [Pimephales promelas]XP_039537998.1 metabolism of cobalamin associated Da [Pimephales promelas]KAG1945881.1 cobalamin trafficking protein CblD [Pimephales promelas]KAG1945882.1 cobalamin trafficking protein CblD [Pimephales promelas]